MGDTPREVLLRDMLVVARHQLAWETEDAERYEAANRHRTPNRNRMMKSQITVELLEAELAEVTQ